MKTETENIYLFPFFPLLREKKLENMWEREKKLLKLFFLLGEKLGIEKSNILAAGEKD